MATRRKTHKKTTERKPKKSSARSTKKRAVKKRPVRSFAEGVKEGYKKGLKEGMRQGRLKGKDAGLRMAKENRRRRHEEENARGVGYFIGKGQPVTGAHVLMFKEAFDLKVPETQFILGLLGDSYYEAVYFADKPLEDVTVALLLRYYALHPEDVPSIQQHDFQEMKEVVSGRDVSTRRLAVLLGRQAASGHRWDSLSPGFRPVTNKLLGYFIRECERGYYDDWLNKIVLAEAESRDIGNILGTGAWYTREQRDKWRQIKAERKHSLEKARKKRKKKSAKKRR